MIGSDATFGGRRNYFTQHGNYNIKDYNYAIEQGWIPEDYKVWWGYEDQKFLTTLGALGVQIEGDRLGLGTNLFSSTQTLVERYGIDMEESELKKKSELIDKLADIDENSEELLLRQGKVPTGEIAVGEYDYHTAALPVIVYNIANDDSIASVTAAVWHNEDQSDLQWVELPQNEDGTYSTNVNIANFNFVLGEYHIHVYAVNTDGQQYFLGEGIGSVQ